jgi:hypothetical protein
MKMAKLREYFSEDQNVRLVAFLEKLIDDARTLLENYDMAAQVLEDELGKIRVSKLIAECLQPPNPLPDVMRERLKLLKGIPFKAVVTTNFDLLLQGDTPGHDPAYDSILRHRRDANFAFSQAGMEALEKLGDPDAVGDDEGGGGDTTEDPLPWPVIKIHGCITIPESMVWTRTGYRELINEVPGYMHFLRTLLATSTVLYIGFSFSDGYLNDVRGEVRSMLYGGSGTRETCTTQSQDQERGYIAHGRCMPRPLGYAIVNDKKSQDVDFFLMHEGVQLLSWDTRWRVLKQPRDFGGMDTYLRNVYTLTSSLYYLGKLAFGHRILMYVQTHHAPAAGTPDTGGGSIKAVRSIKGGQLAKEARLMRMSDLPALLHASLANFEEMKKKVAGEGEGDVRSRSSSFGDAMGDMASVETLVAAFPDAMHSASRDYPSEGCVHVVKDNVEALVGCMELSQYDLVVTVYGWRTETNCVAEDFVKKMRQLPTKNQAPFIVTTRMEGINKKMRQCMKLGAFEIVTNFDDLVHAVTRLLKTMKDPGSARIC